MQLKIVIVAFNYLSSCYSRSRFHYSGLTYYHINFSILEFAVGKEVITYVHSTKRYYKICFAIKYAK